MPSLSAAPRADDPSASPGAPPSSPPHRAPFICSILTAFWIVRVFLACRLTGETSWNFPEVAEAAKPSSAMSPSSMIASDPGEFAPAADMPHSSAVLAPSNYGSGGGRRVSGGGLSLTLGEGVLPRVLIILFCSLVTLISSSVEANQIDKIRAAKEATAAEATPDGTTTADVGIAYQCASVSVAAHL